MTDKHLPPFLSGEAAFRNGKKLTENPHKKDEKVTECDYAFDLWSRGWHSEKWRLEHKQKEEKQHGV